MNKLFHIIVFSVMLIFTYNQTISALTADDFELCENINIEDDVDEEDEIDEEQNDKVHPIETECKTILVNSSKSNFAYLDIASHLLGQKVPSPPPDLL